MNSKSLYLTLTVLLMMLFRIAEATSLYMDDDDFDCGTNPTPEEVLAMEAKFQARLKANGVHLRARDEGPIVLKIYWHVVSKSHQESDGNVPDQVIKKQIDILNRHTRQLQGFRWKLAGLDRTVNAKWFKARKRSAEEQDMIDHLRRQGSTPKDLNVYSFDVPIEKNKSKHGRSGYSKFPADIEINGTNDGVFLHWRTLPGMPEPRTKQAGSTLVHEVGHWLGLYHTFQNGCNDPSDYVDDTPHQASPTKGCPVEMNSCPERPGLDPINNFMDYSSCRTHFTPGQAERARQQFNQFRKPVPKIPKIPSSSGQASSSRQAHLHARDLGWHGTSERLARHLLKMYMSDVEGVIYDDFDSEAMQQ